MIPRLIVNAVALKNNQGVVALQMGNESHARNCFYRAIEIMKQQLAETEESDQSVDSKSVGSLSASISRRSELSPQNNTPNAFSQTATSPASGITQRAALVDNSRDESTQNVSIQSLHEANSVSTSLLFTKAVMIPVVSLADSAPEGSLESLPAIYAAPLYSSVILYNMSLTYHALSLRESDLLTAYLIKKKTVLLYESVLKVLLVTRTREVQLCQEWQEKLLFLTIGAINNGAEIHACLGDQDRAMAVKSQTGELVSHEQQDLIEQLKETDSEVAAVLVNLYMVEENTLSAPAA